MAAASTRSGAPTFTIFALPPSVVRCLEGDLLSMVLELPPAPAALVLLGRWLETFSARSAAAFLRITVAGPPGGLGDAWRAVVVPVAALFTGEVGRGADCRRHVSCWS